MKMSGHILGAHRTGLLGGQQELTGKCGEQVNCKDPTPKRVAC
jgi:hypothetical protein